MGKRKQTTPYPERKRNSSASSSSSTPSNKRRKHKEEEEDGEVKPEEVTTSTSDGLTSEIDEELSKEDADKQEEEFNKICTSLKYKYSIDKMLGSGSFGKVFMGTDIITGLPVALKFVNKHFLTLSDRPDALEDELKVMLRLRHPNVIRLMDILNYWEGWMVIVMELCLGGTLIYDVVEKTKNGLSERRARYMFRQMAEAVNYLHKNNICHRDLNGANILLKHQGRDDIRIVDFGSARIVKSQKDMLTTFSGAEVIRAPEIIKNTPGYDAMKCDMWSMGCILYKMLTNHWPFASVVAAQNANKKGPAYPQKISPEARILLNNLLNVNANKRWTAEQALACDWLKIEDPPVNPTGKPKPSMETRSQTAQQGRFANLPEKLTPSASCIIS